MEEAFFLQSFIPVIGCNHVLAGEDKCSAISLHLANGGSKKKCDCASKDAQPHCFDLEVLTRVRVAANQWTTFVVLSNERLFRRDREGSTISLV